MPAPSHLSCPKCGRAHLDQGEWADKPHHTHLCGVCGHKWRVYGYLRGVDHNLDYTFAKIGYEAFLRKAGGEVSEKWSELSSREQDGWLNAAEEILSTFSASVLT